MTKLEQNKTNQQVIWLTLCFLRRSYCVSDAKLYCGIPLIMLDANNFWRRYIGNWISVDVVTETRCLSDMYDSSKGHRGHLIQIDLQEMISANDTLIIQCVFLAYQIINTVWQTTRDLLFDGLLLRHECIHVSFQHRFLIYLGPKHSHLSAADVSAPNDAEPSYISTKTCLCIFMSFNAFLLVRR